VVNKKKLFLSIFLLTIFDMMLKCPHVSQQPNMTCPEPVEWNRQQAKMTFQFACRKPPIGKDLVPVGLVAQRRPRTN
jgi:hypothetical protein